MPTIAIVGAGPGLGLSIAREFGAHGFRVALISRTRSKLDALVEQLGTEGIEAHAFPADIMRRDTLVTALERAAEHFGGIDVLEFSPAPSTSDPDIRMADILDTTVENVAPQIEYYLYAAIAAARQVLPEMTARGSGTLLFTTGAGSITPLPTMGNINAAAAALRNWAVNLHDPLREQGVHVSHIAIGVYIDERTPETSAASIARTYWDAYVSRDGAERVHAPAVARP